MTLVFSSEAQKQERCTAALGPNGLFSYTFEYMEGCTIATNAVGARKHYYHKDGIVTRIVNSRGAEQLFTYDEYSNLIAESNEAKDIDRIRHLFDDLERKRDIAQFLSLAEDGDGVRIFIGSENKLFSLSGSSLVVSPYMNADRQIIGAIGVIGPTRLNYGRIVPIVDYTAQLVGKLLSERGRG